jgi:Fic family protein
MFAPTFRITPEITRALMGVEASRQAVESLPIDVPMLAALRETARLLATHYSTQIEGNRLTAAQVEVVVGGGAHPPGRERDAAEVRHYYRALQEAEWSATRRGAITEQQIQSLHGLVMEGRKRTTPYRDGQNVIRDAATGSIVYLPPEAKDVPGLMRDLFDWINTQIASAKLPAPLIAALAHYQFATVHPYYDGNWRTARLLTTLILHRTGYGLKGLYSLEEYYAVHLGDYYEALCVGGHHNYYFGRAEADVTQFLEYFCRGMEAAFAKVRSQAEQARSRGALDQSPLLRELSAQQRHALGLFLTAKRITARELAAFLGLSARAAGELCARWVKEGFLVIGVPSKKARSYELAPRYEALVARGLG